MSPTGRKIFWQLTRCEFLSSSRYVYISSHVHMSGRSQLTVEVKRSPIKTPYALIISLTLSLRLHTCSKPEKISHVFFMYKCSSFFCYVQLQCATYEEELQEQYTTSCLSFCLFCVSVSMDILILILNFGEWRQLNIIPHTNCYKTC